jgi:hypothetical protein
MLGGADAIGGANGSTGANANGGAKGSVAGASSTAGHQPIAPDIAAESGLPYPTIHSLPLLGAKYSDYYRRAKIQETVYELLTQQFELAKVQEAKETPSVKTLDPGTVPEKKSFPPRSLIILLGTFLVGCGAIGWVLGSERWKQADPADPRRILAKEVVATLSARAQWFSRNGAGHESNGDGSDNGFDRDEDRDRQGRGPSER